MTDPTLLRRITADPEIFGGKPIIRGMRISVELVLSLLAQGPSQDETLADYPDLEPLAFLTIPEMPPEAGTGQGGRISIPRSS